MTGRLIAVLGRSDAGKDTVINGLCARAPQLHKVQRTITRQAKAEDCASVTQAEFQHLDQIGTFCLAWHSHGLSYGIPKNTLAIVQNGQDAITNLSRGVLLTAQTMFPNLLILSLTVPAKVLAKRLIERGRETEEDIAKRLAQAQCTLPKILDIHSIDNSGPIEKTLNIALAILHPVRA
ncbi:phosphonate metabolism protein/1,5-bisphosphokinase (PRPP-forming) PhnN [Parasulfitobacter algicola]|uniref:Phosphonate metabolism protein/1,5-bisphosphokinase (PRPP-forming) PhnN n=1 Tax=Parasulfitobacter algicola TaxID=2614809 RepID=A0ABX2ILS5_9RHOB|nr:phosphonate metabolism protein/1,5-bisphosphokinase (PRPP-forming) PhnN [Sulfitobacter algicola]NSX53475.1 phosphonate metabolism protein/1,5-bisphosphokinase (PRPP-forming) PhnN [Sulfitobacter algicola]